LPTVPKTFFLPNRKVVESQNAVFRRPQAGGACVSRQDRGSDEELQSRGFCLCKGGNPMKTILATLTVAVCVAIGTIYYVAHNRVVEPAPSPAVAKIEQPAVPAKVKPTDPPGTLVVTGTVKPEEVVEVGAQVNGMVVALGADPTDPTKMLDQGTFVRKGTVLAKIDPTIYQAQVDYAEASLVKAKADLLQLIARCTQMKQEWTRAQSLLPQKAIADTDYDLASANCQMATGNVGSGRAAVQQCEASLQVAKTYLSYTTITSPIDGVILDRRVNVGQIVCATFNVPGLFLVAKDLKRTQIWASVDEADIGRIQPGLPVQFTLDAYPGETFGGKVSRIRLNPTSTQNGATYTVVVATDSGRAMLPYLTAKLRFETAMSGSPMNASMSRAGYSAF
jgi:RND family efflux transporter MFP subunit